MLLELGYGGLLRCTEVRYLRLSGFSRLITVRDGSALSMLMRDNGSR